MTTNQLRKYFEDAFGKIRGQSFIAANVSFYELLKKEPNHARLRLVIDYARSRRRYENPLQFLKEYDILLEEMEAWRKTKQHLAEVEKMKKEATPVPEWFRENVRKMLY